MGNKSSSGSVKLHVLEKGDIPAEAVEMILEKEEIALKEKDYFAVAVSGGYAKCLKGHRTQFNPPAFQRANFSKWRIYFADERCKPLDDPDSNYGVWEKEFFSHVPVERDSVVAIDPSLKPEAAAEKYAKQLEPISPKGFPEFDLMLLGMGPDGHTASLFPGHPLNEEKVKWVASISDSPKPPPERITLTMPVINQASLVMYIATGDSKAELLKRVLVEKDSSLPAQVARGRECHWFVDEAAAASVTPQQRTKL